VHRRSFLKGALALLGAALPSSPTGCRGTRPPERLNLLLVVLEDCTAGSLACYGNPIARTPHLDAFAASAVRFDRAYCQAPVCNPSRASFLSGLRPDSTNVIYNQAPMDRLLPAGASTLPEAMASRGALRIDVGKIFHSAAAARRQLSAFDRIELFEAPEGYQGIRTGWTPPLPAPRRPRGFTWSSDPQLEARLGEAAAQQERAEKAFAAGSREWIAARRAFQRLRSEVVGDSGLPEEAEPDGQKARLSARILQELARSGRQFFLALGFDRPHTPLVCPKEYLDLYDPAKMPAPPAPPEQDRGVPAVARRFGVNFDLFARVEPTPERVRRAIAAYYACLSFVDAQLGLVLGALEETGLAASTMVVVLADHGFHLGEHGCWSKSTLFEQSTRVPLLVRVPGAPANGRACGAIVELVDLFPTICEWWRLEGPRRLEGRSFAPLLEDPDRAWKRAAFCVCPVESAIGRSVRTRRHRYSEWRGLRTASGEPVSAVELYDLEQDPWEQRNLAGAPERREVLARHRALLRRHLEAWPGRDLEGPRGAA
jgi:arylsulfatase A-like enzyme